MKLKFVLCMGVLCVSLRGETVKEWCSSWMLAVDNIRKLRPLDYSEAYSLEPIMFGASCAIVENLKQRLYKSASLQQDFATEGASMIVFDVFTKMLEIDVFYAESFLQVLKNWYTTLNDDQYCMFAIALDTCDSALRVKNLADKEMEKIFGPEDVGLKDMGALS